MLSKINKINCCFLGYLEVEVRSQYLAKLGIGKPIVTHLPVTNEFRLLRNDLHTVKHSLWNRPV